MQDIESQHAVALENLLTERFGLLLSQTQLLGCTTGGPAWPLAPNAASPRPGPSPSERRPPHRFRLACGWRAAPCALAILVLGACGGGRWRAQRDGEFAATAQRDGEPAATAQRAGNAAGPPGLGEPPESIAACRDGEGVDADDNLQQTPGPESGAGGEQVPCLFYEQQQRYVGPHRRPGGRQDGRRDPALGGG